MRPWLLIVACVACSTSTTPDRCPKGPTSTAPFLWSIATDHAKGGNVVATPSGDFVVVGTYGAATAFAGHPLPAGPDVLVAKVTSSGNVTWIQTLDTKGVTVVDAAVDEQGDVVVFGGTQGKSFTLAGRKFNNSTLQYSEATFVAKLAGADGSPLWAQAFIGSGIVPAYVRPSSGKARSSAVVLGGMFEQTATFGATQLTAPAADHAGFVVRLDPADGSVKWARAVEKAVLGTELSPSGDVVLDASYEGASIGLDPAPAPPTLPFGSKGVVFAKLAQADGTPIASAWLTLKDSNSNAAAGALVYDAATARYVFFGSGYGVGFGGTSFTGPFLAAFDDSFTLAWNGKGDNAGRLAPAGNARIGVVGSLVAGIAGGTTGMLGTTFPTRAGAEATTVLLMGLVDATGGALVRGYAVPPTGQVQVGDRGSLRPNGIAAGSSGPLVVSADLDGVVNVDKCDLAASKTDPTLLVFAVGP